jgi:hypothetical protein
MLRKLIIVVVVAMGGALPFAASSLGSRSDELLCFGTSPTITGSGMIVGTEGDDVIVGSDGNDVIHAKGGNDKICGGGGDDQVGAGPGDDQIDGGPGNDALAGGYGNDTLLGGEGNDTFEGGPDTDSCDGGPGTNMAVTTGSEACETVANASPPAAPPAEKQIPLKATLAVGQEVPHPKATRGATGLFTATLTPNATGASLIVWRLTFKRLTGAAVAAHIHLGRPGKAGAILVQLCGPCAPGAHGTVEVSGQPARRAIVSGGAYVNVHTKLNPGGEIRGQIARVGG